MVDLLKTPARQMLLAVLLLVGCTRAPEADPSGVLVSTDWMEAHLNEPDLVILHSGSSEIYDSIHIPGARLIIPAEFTASSGDVDNEIPPADSIVQLLRKAGVNNDSRIVLYSQSASLFSRTARVFVTLDHLGLGDRTLVLNGGLPLWQEEGRELTALVPGVVPGNLEPERLNEVVIKYSALDSQRWSHELVLVDARSDEEYHGTPDSEEGPAEGGHIEGAYFLPYRDLLVDDSLNLVRPDAELEALFSKAGLDPDKKNVVYCGSGIRASVSYLVARHLGYPVLLYDGSYQEWSQLDLPLTGPVAKPDEIE